MVKNKILVIILIASIATAGIVIPIFLLRDRQCDITPGNDWYAAFDWMNENLDSNTIIATWVTNGDYINCFSNYTSLIDSKTKNNTIKGLVGRLFMAVNESESVEILNTLNVSYVLVSWSYYYPDGGGDEERWQSMIQKASNHLAGTKWEIGVEERLNETSSKPTCEFFNTTLWKMLTYGEPFINYYEDDGNSGVIDYLLQQNYPLGYFLARLNWADPWVPGAQPHQGSWEDDSGHLWSYHNSLVDDGYWNYDEDPDDDTAGVFGNLTKFSPVFISYYHYIKIYKIS